MDLETVLLSRFSHVRLCATPETAAHRAPPSRGFSRQEHWSGCHFILQGMKVKSESEVAQSCLILWDPMDCSLPGSSVHGIFQARVLEWVAIAFFEVRSRPDKTLSATFRDTIINTWITFEKNVSPNWSKMDLFWRIFFIASHGT